VSGEAAEALARFAAAQPDDPRPQITAALARQQPAAAAPPAGSGESDD
jgi:hypothetical protein